jgi:hypothetical protein
MKRRKKSGCGVMVRPAPANGELQKKQRKRLAWSHMCNGNDQSAHLIDPMVEPRLVMRDGAAEGADIDP